MGATVHLQAVEGRSADLASAAPNCCILARVRLSGEIFGYKPVGLQPKGYYRNCIG